MKFLLAKVFVFFSINISIAQLGSTSLVGAKSLSMGNTGAAAAGIQSIYFGQAGLTTIEKFSIQLSSERRFNTANILAGSLALAGKVGKIGTVGLFVSSYGIEEYKEQRLGLSYARPLSNKISIGAQLGLNNIRIEEYGNRSYFSIDIGVLAQLTRQLSLGIHLSNPASSEVVDNAETVRVIALGLNYHLSSEVHILADYRKQFELNDAMHIGIDYQIADVLALRIGAQTSPSTMSFGLAIKLNKKVELDGGFSNHQYLGVTPSLSMTYEK